MFARMMGHRRSLAVSVSPASLSGNRSGAGVCLTSLSATASALGGSGHYGFSWVPSVGITASNPGFAQTLFQATLADGQTLNGNAFCNVRDTQTNVILPTQPVIISLAASHILLTASIPGGTLFTSGPFGGQYVLADTRGSGASAGPFSQSFTVNVQGTGTFTYQWAVLLYGGNSTTRPTIANAQSATCTVTWFNAPNPTFSDGLIDNWILQVGVSDVNTGATGLASGHIVLGG